MNITFIGKYPPIVGGESTKLYWLAKNLGKRGHNCNIVSDCQERDNKANLSLEDLAYLQPENVRLFSTSETSTWESEREFRTERLTDLAIRTIEYEDSDLIIGWYLIPYCVSASLASKYTHLPFVLQHAGSDIKRLFGSPNLKCLLMNQLSSADGIMAYPSYYSLFKQLNENVFLHNPKIDMKEFSKCPNFTKPEEIREKKLITYLGKFSETKGIFDLLKAYEKIGESEEFALVYIGSGAKKRELEELMKTKGFKNVYIYPPIPPWKVPGLLRASNIFFVGERDFYVQKHFSRKPMEALACRTPLLISSEVKNKGIYRNLIDGVHCLEINPKRTEELSKKIKFLLDNDNLSQKISENGYEFAKKANDNFEEYIRDVETFLMNTAQIKKNAKNRN